MILELWMLKEPCYVYKQSVDLSLNPKNLHYIQNEIEIIHVDT